MTLVIREKQKNSPAEALRLSLYKALLRAAHFPFDRAVFDVEMTLDQVFQVAQHVAIGLTDQQITPHPVTQNGMQGKIPVGVAVAVGG